MLVAAKSTANKMAADKIVPMIPSSKADRGMQLLLQEDIRCANDVAMSVTARKRIAMPKATIENIGVKVITAVT